MRPVLDLLVAEKVEWTEEHSKVVNQVMEHLKANCFLKLPSYDRPFHIATDYSGVGIGAVLMQHDDKGDLLPL